MVKSPQFSGCRSTGLFVDRSVNMQHWHLAGVDSPYFFTGLVCGREAKHAPSKEENRPKLLAMSLAKAIHGLFKGLCTYFFVLHA